MSVQCILVFRYIQYSLQNILALSILFGIYPRLRSGGAAGAREPDARRIAHALFAIWLLADYSCST